MTRSQVLAWNPRWSYTDKETIEENMDRLGAVSFYRPGSGGYLNCVDADGVIVMQIYRGYLYFKKRYAPPNANKWNIVGLSIVQWRDGRPAKRIRVQEFCDSCGMLLPLTGPCGNCT